MNNKQNYKPLGIRKKHYLAVASLCISILISVYLMTYYTGLFVIPLGIIFFSIAFWSSTVKCPGCKGEVYLNPSSFRFIGIERYAWTFPFLPAKCSECDLDFD